MNIKLPEYCHCGKKMHLSFANILLLKQFGEKWGQFRKIKYVLTGKQYKVPTYYILCHSVLKKPLDKLGFPEWSEAKKKA